MHLNAPGGSSATIWMDIPRHFLDVDVDTFMVMPNHLHAILVLRPTSDGRGQGLGRRAPTVETFGHPVPGSVATIIRSAKAASSRQINLLRGTPGAAVWQRGYFEHIIRTPCELDRLRRYSETNPMRWALDRE